MRVSSLLLLLASACSIKPGDYTGKACAGGVCPAGYVCNLATNTCGTSIIADVGGVGDDIRDSAPPDAPGDIISDSCFANPRSELVYSSVGFEMYPQGWSSGDGTWGPAGNELVQSNGNADVAWVSRAIGDSNTADYRIVATMRMTDSDFGGGIGVAFRVSSLGMYACTADPLTGRLELVYTQQGFDMWLDTRNVSFGNAMAPFTMEIDVTGASLKCCIRGIANATVSVPNYPALLSGRAGLTTRDRAGAFASFHAYR